MKLEVSIQPIDIGKECDDSQIREILRGWIAQKRETNVLQRELDYSRFLYWLCDHIGDECENNQALFDSLQDRACYVAEVLEDKKLKC